MTTLDLGILAHVDAGKTSLTERLLHAAGVIDVVGRVDDGSTTTDSLDLERQRGITIRSAVVSFTLGDLVVNLVDTPGHSDFVAEVERVLGVLDGAVLVVSAVEGVQGRTRILMRVLQRLGVPTLLFVNKIDRAGAREDEVLAELAERLTPSLVPLGTVTGLGTRAAAFAPWRLDDPRVRDRAFERLAEHDDALLADGDTGHEALHAALARQSRAARVHPVLFGSAMTGTGVPALVDAVRAYLPRVEGDAGAPLSGEVFGLDRAANGEKVALVHVSAGTLRVRDRVALPGTEAKVTALEVYDAGSAVPVEEVSAGRIARVRGLAPARVGDRLGEGADAVGEAQWFARPTLETVVEPVGGGDRGRLHAALTRLSEQDPLIDLRQDDVRGELWVSLYGEVQKEVLAATLRAEEGLEVAFRETTTICVERVVGTGEAHEVIDVDPNPFLATVGLRVGPAPVGSGVRLGLDVELGSMPPAFFTAVDEAVRGMLRQGLHGWEVPDAEVTITHSGYWARQSHAHGTFDASMSSTAGDFRNLAPLVLADALRKAGTVVCEPVHRFELETPGDRLSATLAALARHRAVPLETTPRGTSYLVSGEVPAARVHRLQQEAPTVTGGEGELVTVFDHHAPVQGPPPERSRTDLDPLHRKDYLLRLARRV